MSTAKKTQEVKTKKPIRQTRLERTTNRKASPPKITMNKDIETCSKLSPNSQNSDSDTEDLLPNIGSSSLRAIIRDEINRAIKDSITVLVNEQCARINDIVAEFKVSLSFFNTKFEEMKKTIEVKSAEILKLQNDSAGLQKSLTEVTKRMNILEQHARSNNIEIQCVPEHRTENVVNTVLQLGKIIKCEVKDTDIQLCTRTAKRDTQNVRPRSILVKFNNPRLRDSFLAASIEFNKNNSKAKLNTSHLGIAVDKPEPIYVVEHLSPENKALHAATRIRAKELCYKFVWVRYGKVFIKKDETSETVLISGTDKLRSLV